MQVKTGLKTRNIKKRGKEEHKKERKGGWEEGKEERRKENRKKCIETKVIYFITLSGLVGYWKRRGMKKDL